jgi:hypothetical protein
MSEEIIIRPNSFNITPTEDSLCLYAENIDVTQYIDVTEYLELPQIQVAKKVLETLFHF